MGTKKILAINGSPRAQKSSTNLLIEPFLAGARQAGAETESVFVTKMEIKDCIGCFGCWNKTPGTCVLKDDMAMLLEKIKSADIVVWGTPLYHFGMTARLKRILERTLPLAQPYIIKKSGHFGHPPRYEKQPGNVLIANCGFPERHHFDALVQQFNHLAGADSPFIAAILCTSGEALKYHDFSWYLEAVCQAGQEVIKSGNISEETAAILAKQLVPLEDFIKEANASWNVPGEQGPSFEQAMRGEYKA